MSILDRLVSQLALEQVDDMRFVGRSTDIFLSGRVFGGQVLGQALMAANYTAPEGRSAHSMHAYFVRPADASLAIEYDVENIRDGGSFSVRRVTASQHGKFIFTLSCSYQGFEEGFEHQIEMPITEGLYHLIYQDAELDTGIKNLMGRQGKAEASTIDHLLNLGE